MEKIKDRIILVISILMLAVFLPVLFCVIFIGNNMDYFEVAKIPTMYSNIVLAMVALAGIAACVVLCRLLPKELGRKTNIIIDIILAGLFFLLYFMSVRMAKEISFRLPWDVEIVRGIAYFVARKEPLGYYYYLSMYTNNIPISYILGIIYRKVTEAGIYPYVPDFAWVQIDCMLLSIGGFFACLTIKKVTRRLMPVVVTFLLYLLFVQFSPWMMAPYTDTYGIVFPILCIYFYLCYRNTERTWQKYLFIILSLISGMVGGLIKPSIYVMVIAVVGAEAIFLLKEHRKNIRFFLVQIVLLLFLFAGTKVCMNRMIEEIGLDFNPEIEMSWQHYFMMGLNEETTGNYSSDDAGFVTYYQTSKSERCAAELREAAARIKERGFWGTIYFWLRKMVMDFNDGTHGWRDQWVGEYYPEELVENTALTEFLRNIFWSEGAYVLQYNTFCQFAWIFCMLCMPGICLAPKEKREKYLIFVVAFLGIFFYQMFFEARARYLFVFLPVLLVVSACGLQQYADYAGKIFRHDNKSTPCEFPPS